MQANGGLAVWRRISILARPFAEPLTMRNIVAVTFDLWDTLIQEHPGGSDKVAEMRVREIGSVLSSAGLPREPSEIMAAHEKTGQFLRLVWEKSRDLSTGDQVAFMLDSIDPGLRGRLNADDLRRAETAYSEGILEYLPRVLPGAREALAYVRDSGCRTGLISNTGRTPGSVLRSVMERLDILEFFEATTFSNEILVRKPAKRAFLTTLDALGVRPMMAAHIGDDPKSDISGAKRAGMKAIQVAARGLERSPEADRAVGSLWEIPATLDIL